MNFKLLPLALICANLNATTYYVATTGLDTNDGINEPVKTIKKGISKLDHGDTLIVKTGIYNGKENFISKLPSGTKDHYTIVKAENPYFTRINSTEPLLYADNMILLDGEFMKVDGFVINLENSRFPPYNAAINGDYNKITRTIFRRAGIVDAYGGWVEVNGSYNLVEDSAGVGAARYGFKTGGTNSTASNNIFRRDVGRFDYTASNQPKGTFNHYGNNSGWFTNNIIYQNCISLDGNQPDYHGGTSGFKMAGFGSIKNSGSDLYQGNIVLNEATEYDAFWIDGRGTHLEDNVAWDTHKGAYGSNIPVGFWIRSGTTEMSLVDTTSGMNAGGALRSYSTGLIQINNLMNPPYKKYLTLPDEGTIQGATIIKQYGVTGTLYGEAGFDKLTTVNLWPWVGENAIKAVFSEPNATPVGYTPPSNNSVRGFTTEKDQYGTPQTLTKYVWQYLNVKIPDYVYAQANNTCVCP